MKKIILGILTGLVLTLAVNSLLMPKHSAYDASIPLSYEGKKIIDKNTPDSRTLEEDQDKKKPDQPSAFVVYYNKIRTHFQDTKPAYRPNYRISELAKAQQHRTQLKSQSIQMEWVERGPGNVSGRTRGLIIDKEDPSGNTWITGSVGGGIWKTTNAGQSWTNLTPNLPTLSTVCLAQASSDPKVLYAGTGEGFYNTDAIIGNGIFKSTDKGNTWSQLAATASNEDFFFVNRIIVSPDNADVVLSATNTSIQRSTDGGASWTTVYDDYRRIQQIIARPDNFDVLFATSNTGGVLKSIDKGLNWQYVLEDLSGRVELAISPSQPDKIYALTENSKLYVSDDSGNSWAPAEIISGTKDLFLSTQGWYNNTLAVYPDDPEKLIIGGLNVYQVEVTGTSSNPKSFFNVTTENTNGFLSFTNFGGAYLNGGMDINSDKTDYSTIEIQFGKGKSQKAHRFLVPQGSTSGVPDSDHTYADYVDVPFEVWDITHNRQLMVSFRDQDRNGEFNLTALDDNALIGREYIWINDVDYKSTPSASIAVNGGQAYEELAFCWPVLRDGSTWNPDNLPDSKIVINRADIYVHEIDSKKIADWNAQGAPYVHADNHNVQFTTTASGKTRIVITNDGGIGYTDNLGITWTNPSNGYNCTQFYGVDKNPLKDQYVGGLQDNGSWVSAVNPNNLSSWNEATGGDGFDVVWNSADPNKLITSLYFNDLYVSNDQGETWSYASGDLGDEGQNNAPFVTQIGYSVNDPEKLFVVGTSGVSWSKDFGGSWNLSPIPDSIWSWSGSGFVEPSLPNPGVVWAGSQMSSYGHIMVSEDAGKSFKRTADYKEEMGVLSGLATHPLNDSVAYALFSYAGYPKILRTSNLGKSWEDITEFSSGESQNGFPDVAVYSLLVMPQNPNEIWVGTEIGLFISTDNGKSWHYADNGLPAVSIWEMKIRGTQVILATHGRGVWTVDIPEIANAVKAPTLLSAGIAPSNTARLNVLWGAAYDSVRMVIDNDKNIALNYNSSVAEEVSYQLHMELSEGAHNLKLIGFKDGLKFQSGQHELTVVHYDQSTNAYENTFNENSNDFVGDGFKIMNLGALGTGMAIHSNHPYPDNVNISYYLKKPIVIATSGTKMSYEDIPFIEEGESGSKFGSANFYDYVIAEGTTDGIIWKPLLDGYDFRKIKFKANQLSKTVDDQPTRALFMEHTINLDEIFTKGDTIAVRFRLFSDANTNGWGWVIDNIVIAPNEQTGIASELNSSNSIYPVPCNTLLHVKLNEEFARQTEIILFDLQGRKINTVKSENQNNITLNTAELKTGNYLMEIRSGQLVERKKFSVYH